ncbi:MAG: pseudouridine synthase, partial [Chloroflexota bacterium]
MEERLQKIMAQAGLGSRRDCEEYIVAGRVRVNGITAVIGQKADPASDTVTLDGRAIKPAEQKVYIALHKPRYVLSTVDAEQGDSRQTVRDLIDVSERLYPVGRLDFESEGLILMTNDGELAQKLTHPSHGHSKEYRVLLARQPDVEQLATWQRGVVLEDGYKTQHAEVRTESLSGKGAWIRIIMREGRKRQIREIGAMLALPVVRIVRIRIGNLLLGDLKPGEWRYLTPVEVKALKEDRPGLAPYPDMTRKTPSKFRVRESRKETGRTGSPSGNGRAPGRTAPPSGNGKAPGRTGPPSGSGRASGRTAPPSGDGRTSDRNDSSAGSNRTSDRKNSSSVAGRGPARSGPPSELGRAPDRKRSPSSAGRAPDRTGSSSDAGRGSDRNGSPSGAGRTPYRKRTPSSAGRAPDRTGSSSDAG